MYVGRDRRTLISPAFYLLVPVSTQCDSGCGAFLCRVLAALWKMHGIEFNCVFEQLFSAVEEISLLFLYITDGLLILYLDSAVARKRVNALTKGEVFFTQTIDANRRQWPIKECKNDVARKQRARTRQQNKSFIIILRWGWSILRHAFYFLIGKKRK